MKNRALSLITRNVGLSLSVILGVLFAGAVAVSAAITSGAYTSDHSDQVTYTEVDVARPASVVSGDLMLATIAVNGGGAAVLYNAPSGWTLVASTSNDTNVSLRTYYRIATASDTSTSTYLWRFLGQTTAEGSIIPYKDIDISDPIDGWSENTGFGTLATTSAVTTDRANDQVIALFGIDVGKSGDAGAYFSTSTTPYGMSEKYDLSNTPFGPSISAQHLTYAPIGNNTVASTTISGNKSRNWVAHEIALHQTPPTVTVVATGGHDSGYNSSGTFSVNSNGGTACFLGFGGYRGVTVSSLTWGGNAMTQAARNQSLPGAYSTFHADLWYIKNPPSGSQTLSYTFTGGTASGNDDAFFGWLCTSGEASSPIGAIATTSEQHGGSFYSFSLPLTTTASNSLIIGSMFHNQCLTNMAATGANSTLAWDTTGSSSCEGETGLYQTTTSAASYTPGFSWGPADSDPDVGVAVEVLTE